MENALPEASSRLQRRRLLAATAAAALLPLAARASAHSAPLRMAAHPMVGPLALVAMHRPLFEYLEHSLQRRIEFHTSPNFKAYIEALLAGEFDLAISPPHFMLLAIEEGPYQALARYAAWLEPLLGVRANSPIRGLRDLAGQRIAMAEPLALMRLATVPRLADSGLVAGQGYQIVERVTHSAALMAALHGDAEAGLAHATTVRQQTAAVQTQLRSVPTGLRLPNLITLAHQRLGPALIERTRAALMAFTPEHPQGRAFFEPTTYQGYAPVSADDLALLRPFLEPTRLLLEALRRAAPA